MDFREINCPTCGPGPVAALGTVHDINLLVPGEFQLVRCRRCRLLYLNPQPTPARLAAHYPRHYWVPPPPPAVTPHLDAGARAALAHLVRHSPGGRVLDVGCGNGSVVALMRRNGLDALGLEPSAHAAALARECYGIEVQVGMLQDAAIAAGSLDAVTLLDVIEHLSDPLGDLRRAHALLKPGGRVYVKTPNAASLQACLFRRGWYPLDAPRHLFLFSPASLRRLLVAAGFTPQVCRALPDRLGATLFETSVIYWLRGLQWRRKRVAPTAAAASDGGNAPADGVYASVPSTGKRAFRWAVRHLLYAPLAVENAVGRSVELYAVARK